MLRKLQGYNIFRHLLSRLLLITKSYPRGVFALSSIECFERFGFYGIHAILVLYIAAGVHKGGLGWSNAAALQLIGIFSALLYATPILGGWIADKYTGRKNAVMLGNIVLFIGYLILTIQNDICLFISLTLIIIGTGFLKPSISAMIGEFYEQKDEKNQRDSAFAIFYMGINIGGTAGSLIAGYIAEVSGYSFAFAASAFGMVIAIINTIVSSSKSLAGIGERNSKKMEDSKKMVYKWTAEETKRFWVYIGLCISNILWNVFYALPYGLLTLWADTNINRVVFGFTIPAAWFYGGYSVIIILFSPVLASVYGFLAKKNKDFALSYKLSSGYFLLAVGCLTLMPLVIAITANRGYVGNMIYLILFYVFFSISEILTVPVLLSAATKFAPKDFSATLVSLNMLISWSIGGFIGGEVSALTEVCNPTYVFVVMIVLCIIFGFGHIFTNKYIEKVCKSNQVTSNI